MADGLPVRCNLASRLERAQALLLGPAFERLAPPHALFRRKGLKLSVELDDRLTERRLDLLDVLFSLLPIAELLELLVDPLDLSGGIFTLALQLPDADLFDIETCPSHALLHDVTDPCAKVDVLRLKILNCVFVQVH